MTVGREIAPIGQATGKWHEARGKTFLLVAPSPAPLAQTLAIAAEALMNNAGESAGLLGHDLEEFDLEH
jgi:hypothetical protein